MSNIVIKNLNVIHRFISSTVAIIIWLVPVSELITDMFSVSTISNNNGSFPFYVDIFFFSLWTTRSFPDLTIYIYISLYVCLIRTKNCLPFWSSWVRVTHLVSLLCCLCFACLSSVSCVLNVAIISGLSIWVSLMFICRLTRRVPLVEKELLTLPEYLSSPPVFSGVQCYSIFSFICMFCRSLFVLLYFFFWQLCCLFFFDIRFLIAPFVSSNSSSFFGFRNIISWQAINWTWYATRSRTTDPIIILVRFGVFVFLFKL